MKSFRASVVIDAAPLVIWRLLADPAAWPKWNPTVEYVEGHLADGHPIRLYVTRPTRQKFLLRVVEFSPPRLMVWRGGMPFGLFTGTRTFKLTPQTDGTTRFDMEETFTGLLAPLITRVIPDLQPTFDEVVQCLKKAAETT